MKPGALELKNQANQTESDIVSVSVESDASVGELSPAKLSLCSKPGGQLHHCLSRIPYVYVGTCPAMRYMRRLQEYMR